MLCRHVDLLCAGSTQINLILSLLDSGFGSVKADQKTNGSDFFILGNISWLTWALDGAKNNINV